MVDENNDYINSAEYDEPMPARVASDETLVTLNTEIEDALKQYLPSDVLIRFDLPEEGEKVPAPTVCVFLYDIQEDLQLRHGESRQYVQSTGRLLPGYVNIRCCYLVTYFEPTQQYSVAVSATSQAVIVINQALNALVNHRTFTSVPGSYTRVIPPTEQLNSLGNFWQAVGNKPRLCLSYMVTVPLRLTDPNTIIPKVETVEAGVEQQQKAVVENKIPM